MEREAITLYEGTGEKDLTLYDKAGRAICTASTSDIKQLIQGSNREDVTLHDINHGVMLRGADLEKFGISRITHNDVGTNQINIHNSTIHIKNSKKGSVCMGRSCPCWLCQLKRCINDPSFILFALIILVTVLSMMVLL